MKLLLAKLFHGQAPSVPAPTPKLSGKHVLAARFDCGCVAILCPQEPEILYLPGAGGCKIEHSSTRH